MKRKTVRLTAVAAAAALALTMFGCAGAPAPQQQGQSSSSAAEEAVQPEEPSTDEAEEPEKKETELLDDVFYVNHDNMYDNNGEGPVITSVDGKEVKLDISQDPAMNQRKVKILGPVREDMVFVSWTDSAYDEKFKETTDRKSHVGAFGTDGKMVFDLDAFLGEKCEASGTDSSDSFYMSAINQAAYFNDDVAVLEFDGAYTKSKSTELLCVDSKGQTKWTQTGLHVGGSITQYENGLLVLSNLNDSVQAPEAVVDTSGKTVFDIKAMSEGPLSKYGMFDSSNVYIAGEDLIFVKGAINTQSTVGSADFVCKLDGTVILCTGEEEKKFGDMMYVNSISDAYNGVAKLNMSEISPNGTGKTIGSGSGVFLLTEDKWLVEPTEKDFQVEWMYNGYSIVKGGVDVVNGGAAISAASSASSSSSSSGSSAASSSSKGVYVVDSKGSVVVSSKDFSFYPDIIRYFDDGWWYFADVIASDPKSVSCCAVNIDDSKLEGIVKLDAGLSIATF